MTNKKEKVGNAFCHIYLIVLSLIDVYKRQDKGMVRAKLTFVQ